MRYLLSPLEKITKNAKRHARNIVLSAALAAASCSPSPPDSTSEDLIGVPENTQVVLTDNSLIINQDIEEIQIGSVLSGYDQNNLPYLRKVNAITQDNGSLILDTRQASLTEAIDKGAGNFSAHLDFTNRTPNASVTYTIVNNDSLTASGRITWGYDYYIDGELEIDNATLERFFLRASGQLYAALGINATFHNPYNNTHEISLTPVPIPGPPIHFIVVTPSGIPIPVYIQPSLDLFLGLESIVDAEGQTYFESHHTFNTDFWVNYQYGAWSLDHNAQGEIDNHGVFHTIEGDANLKGYFKPEVNFLVYNVVGPTISLRPYLELDAVEDLPNSIDWTLGLGIDGTVGIEASAFDQNFVDVELPLPFDFHTILATGHLEFPTTNDKILFNTYRDGNPEIYVVDSNGNNLHNLTNHPGEDLSPDVSPNGNTLAFQSNRAGSTSIYVANFYGSNVHQITDQAGADHNAKWSPVGSKIAFESSTRDGNPEIYVVNANGSDLHNITNHSADDNNPTWNPDGSKIAFESRRNGNWDIYVVNVDGNNLRNITNRPSNDTSPSWSPDGSKIAFTSGSSIYLIHPDGRNLHSITSGDAPSWNPDGSKIAFISKRDGNEEIYVMNSDGSNQTRLTYNPYGDWSPTWNPDGNKIAFESWRSNGAFSEVYVINSDGSNQINLTNHPTEDGHPSWSSP